MSTFTSKDYAFMAFYRWRLSPLSPSWNPCESHTSSSDLVPFFLFFIFLHLIEFLLFFYSGFCRWRYDAFFTAQKEDAELMQRISKNVMFWYFNQLFLFQGLLVTTVYIFGNLWCWPWPGLTKNIQLYYRNKSFSNSFPRVCQGIFAFRVGCLHKSQLFVLLPSPLSPGSIGSSHVRSGDF